MRTIGFVTHAAEPELSRDDRLAVQPLREHGVEAVAVPWEHGLPPAHVEALVLRSSWSYHQQPGAYRDWIDQVERAGIPLWNPPEVVRWNLHKRYLVQLSALGARVPRTVCIERGARVSLASVLDGSGLGESVVLKPAISLNGIDTHLFEHARTHADAEATFRALLRTTDVVVQDFVPEVRTEGEVSLVFLAGSFSHAVRKRPALGEFRVQVEHGGTREAFEPTTALIEQARRLLSMTHGELLYARVDGVLVGGELVLMELELIDPMLFLGYAPEAPARFARAIASLASRSA